MYQVLRMLVLLFIVVQCSENAVAQQITLPSSIDQTADQSFEEIKSGIVNRYSDIWAVDVEYKQVTNHASNFADPVIPQMKYHFIWKGEKRYRYQAKPTDSLNKLEDSFVIAYDGNDEQTYRATIKNGGVRPEKQAFIDSDAYFQALGIAVSDEDRATAENASYFLPEALKNSKLQWEVATQMEAVDGSNCYVLRCSDGQRIWVDAASYAVRFREIRYSLENEELENIPVLYRYWLSDYRSVSGIEMPFKNVIEAYYGPRSPKSRLGEVSLNTVHQVSSIKLNNEVKDDSFRIPFPPGTTVRDRVAKKFYRVGDGGEELVILAENASNEMGQKSSRLWGYVLMGTVGAGFLLFVAIRKRGI